MNLQRMRELAGIKLTEGVAAVPGIARPVKIKETAPPGMENMVMNLKKEYPGDESKAFATAWSIYDKKHGKTEEGIDEAGCDMQTGEGCDETIQQAVSRFMHMVDSFVDVDKAFDIVSRDMTPEEISKFHELLNQQTDADNGDYADVLDRANIDDLFDKGETNSQQYSGYTPDSDYDEYEVDESADSFGNGYDEINDADGNDYFPDGADSPVVSRTGPSGSRQGDNPQQKKMQVDEVHKELVYGYRNYLKESRNRK